MSFDSVRALFAVNVSVCFELLPTVVVGKAVVGPLRTGVTGDPNASTLPSRLPTYNLPAPTPGML